MILTKIETTSANTYLNIKYLYMQREKITVFWGIIKQFNNIRNLLTLCINIIIWGKFRTIISHQWPLNIVHDSDPAA